MTTADMDKILDEVFEQVVGFVPQPRKEDFLEQQRRGRKKRRRKFEGGNNE